MSDLNYLHLYLGCVVRVKCNAPGNDTYYTGKMVEVSTKGSNHCPWIEVRFDEVKTVYRNGHKLMSDMHHFFIGHDEISLLLRPLDSMTLEEVRELFDAGIAPEFGQQIISEISESMYTLYARVGQLGDFTTIPKLLQKGFDIFGLIRQGLALDATQIQPAQTQ